MDWKRYIIVIFVELSGTALMLFGLIMKLIPFSDILSFFLGFQGIIFSIMGVTAYVQSRRRKKQEYNYND